MSKKRCPWLNLKNPIYIKYHDNEWGRPNHNDQKQKVLIKSEISQKSIRNVFETIQMLKQKKEMVYQKKKAKSTLRKSI